MGRGKKRYREYSSDEESSRSVKKRLDRMERMLADYFGNDNHRDRHSRYDRSEDRDYRHHYRSRRIRTPRSYYGSHERAGSSVSREYESDRSTSEIALEDSAEDRQPVEDPKPADSNGTTSKNNDTPVTITVDGGTPAVAQQSATGDNVSSGDKAQNKTPPSAPEATVPATLPDGADVSLDPAVLEKLGDRLKPDRVLLPAIHKDLTVRVEEIIHKGLPATEKKTLLQKFPPPQNGPFMDPPKLNFEIKTNVPESIVKRDERIVEKQERLSASLSGITKLMSMTLQLPQDQKLDMLEILGGVSRVLADLQHEESEIRRSLILKNIDPSKRDILKSTASGDLLFGGQLEEKFKAARLLEATSKKFKPGSQSNANSESKNSKGPLRRQSYRSQHNSTTSGQKSAATSSQKSHRSQPYQKSSGKSFPRNRK